LEVDDEAHPSTQTHGRNQRKTPQLVKSKFGPKNLQKSQKWKTLQRKIGDDSTQKDSYIDANQEFTRCGNHPNILPLFGRFGRSHTSLLSSLRHEAHTTPSKNEDLKLKGWERDTSHNSTMVLFIAKTKRLECPYGLKEKLHLMKVVWSDFHCAAPDAIEPTIFHFTST
jgi:hypothetical protein